MIDHSQRRRRMFKSKIHRAVVTDADLNYEGSITIDRELMAAADILPHEEVHIWNVTRGGRLTTYVLGGEPGGGTVCVNGAAAHLVAPGDIVIIATFCDVVENEASSHQSKVVLVDAANKIASISTGNESPPARHFQGELA